MKILGILLVVVVLLVIFSPQILKAMGLHPDFKAVSYTHLTLPTTPYV